MKFYRKKTIIEREEGVPYLIRYTLFTCRWFSVKLHNIFLSDYDCHHDHPWSFISIILKGGYVEHTTKWTAIEEVPMDVWLPKHIVDLPNNRMGFQSSKLYGRWSILYRKAEHIHKLEIHQPVWTLVITFKKQRQWGFWTSGGWQDWLDYKPTQSCE